MFESQRQVIMENPEVLGQEGKFNIAMRKSTVFQFKRRVLNDIPTFDDTLILYSRHYRLVPYDIVYDVSIYPRILERVLNFPLKFPVTLSPDRSKDSRYGDTLNIMKFVKESTMIQLRYMNKNNFLPNIPNCRTKMQKYFSQDDCPKEIMHITAAVTEFSEVLEKSKRVFKYTITSVTSEDRVNEMREEILRGNFFNWDAVDMTFVWSRHILYVQDHREGITCILPRSYILLIHNKFCDLLSVLLLAHYGSMSIYQTNAYDITIQFVKENIKLVKRYGNDYFGIAKTLEALVNAEHLIVHDTWKNTEFLLTLNEDLLESSRFDYMDSMLRDIIRSGNTVLRNELSCLGKLMGHPLVDMEEGAAALYKKVTNVADIDPQAVQMVINCAKREYINSFIVRHGRWPTVYLDHATDPIIKAAWALGVPFFSSKLKPEYQREPPLESYVHVELGVDMRFSYLENFLPFLKDKTLSLLKDDVVRKFINETTDKDNHEYGQTRLLLYYLMQPKSATDHVSFIKKYMESDDLEDLANYMVIKAVPKEKELKELFRGFGCKTYHERARALVQEKNVMKYLDLYSAEQVMTSTELEIENKLNAFRNLHKTYTQHKILYISIDASSWNNRFCERTVDDVHREFLDKIFGTSIFSKTHKAFQKSLVYIPDEEGTYYWQGQEGGIEGLNQDTWVAVYIPMLHAALRRCNYKYYILCKGDDLRVAIVIPPRALRGTTIKQVQRSILQEISGFLSKVGHQVKVEECYGSSSLFTFSKNPSINGICLPQGFRKIQKCHGANNAILPCMDTYMSSTLSNAHSAAKVLPNPLSAYCVGLWWFYYYLCNSPDYRGLGEDHLIAASLIPSVVGGFPLIYLMNFYVRAEADLLPTFIDLYQFLRVHNSNVANVLVNFMEVKNEVPNDISGLCADIYSLPTLMPTIPTTKLRLALYPHLSNITQNETLLELLRLSKSDEVKECIEVLSSAEVLIMKPIQIIFEALPEALLSRFIRKFDSARSVFDAVTRAVRSRRRAKKIMRPIIRSEMFLQEWRAARLRDFYTPSGRTFVHLASSGCPARQADKIRRMAWGKPVVGVTMPPMCHLMEYGTRIEFSEDPYRLSNHFTYLLDDYNEVEFLNNDREKIRSWAKGTRRPFLGYKTSAGTIAPSIHFVEKDDILTTIKNLIEVLQWYDKTVIIDGIEKTSNVRKLIEKVIKLYTRRDLNELDPFTGQRKSGTPEHHLPSSSFMRSIVPNCLNNLYTQITGVTNSHQMYRSSNKYKLNMLQILCHSISMITLELSYSKSLTSPEEVWGATVNCDHCNTPILEELLKFDDKKIDRLQIPELRNLTIGEISMDILIDSLAEFQKKEKFTYVDPQPGDVEISSKAIIQMFLEQNLKETLTVSTQSHRQLTTTGDHNIVRPLLINPTAKIISKTELKKALTIPMIQSLAHYVYDYIIGSSRKEYRFIPFDRMIHPILHHARTLPWFQLCCTLQELGRLQDVMNKVSRRVGFETDYTSASMDATVATLTHMLLIYARKEIIDLDHPQIEYVNDMALKSRKGLMSQFLVRIKYALIEKYAMKDLDPVMRRTRRIGFNLQTYFDTCHLYRGGIEEQIIFDDPIEANHNLVHHIDPVINLAIALTIGYSDIHNPITEELANITNAEGYVKLSEICDIQLPSISEITIDQMKSTNATLFYDVIRYFDNINEQDIDDILRLTDEWSIEDHRIYIAKAREVENFLAEMNVKVRILSKVQAIETVRSLPDMRIEHPARAPLDALNITDRISLSSQLPRKSRRRILKIKERLSSTPINRFNITRAESAPMVLPSVAQYLRPLGIITGTYSILMDIFSTFQLKPGIENMTIIAVGTGAGGDMVFLSQMYPKCSMWIITKLAPGTTIYDTSIVNNYVSEDNLGDYYTEHLREGLTDAGDPCTWRHVRYDMGKSNKDHMTNLIWCDIDYAQTNTYYRNIMNQLIEHYIYYTSDVCMIITKIDMTNPDTLRFIYIMRSVCHDFYLYRSPLMISCRYAYALGFRKKIVPMFNNPEYIIDDLTPLSAELYPTVEAWVQEYIKDPIDARSNVSYWTLTGDPTLSLPTYPAAYRRLWVMKPLFESMLRSRLGISISIDMINKMLQPLTHLRPIPTHYHYDNLIIDYKGIVNQFKIDLDGRNRISHYSINTQANRVAIIRKYMRLMGFKLVHDLGLQNKPFNINYQTMRTRFWDHYVRLSNRDRDYNLAPSNSVFMYNHEEHNIRPAFFNHFIRGLNIGLALVGFILYHHPNFHRGVGEEEREVTEYYIGDNIIYDLDDYELHNNRDIPDEDDIWDAFSGSDET